MSRNFWGRCTTNTYAYSREARTNFGRRLKIRDFLTLSSQTRSDAYCVLAKTRRADAKKISTIIESPLRRDVTDAYSQVITDRRVIQKTIIFIFHMCQSVIQKRIPHSLSK